MITVRALFNDFILLDSLHSTRRTMHHQCTFCCRTNLGPQLLSSVYLHHENDSTFSVCVTGIVIRSIPSSSDRTGDKDTKPAYPDA